MTNPLNSEYQNNKKEHQQARVWFQLPSMERGEPCTGWVEKSRAEKWAKRCQPKLGEGKRWIEIRDCKIEKSLIFTT